jgi:hypothetical protein
MLATHAQTDLHDIPMQDARERVGPVWDEEDIAPARGLVFGVALGLLSLCGVAALFWWVFA